MKDIFGQPKFFTEDSYTYKDITVWILSPAKTKLNPPHRAGGIVGRLQALVLFGLGFYDMDSC